MLNLAMAPGCVCVCVCVCLNSRAPCRPPAAGRRPLKHGRPGNLSYSTLVQIPIHYVCCRRFQNFANGLVFVAARCVALFAQFCNGGSLQSLIDAAGPLPERMCRLMARSALRALAWLHARRMIHRDVKCHNLFLNGVSAAEAAAEDKDEEVDETSAGVEAKGGGTWQLLLGDFGILTRLAAADDVSRTLVGTLLYMSVCIDFFFEFCPFFSTL